MTTPNGPGNGQDSWGSKLGVILAVAGSAVGLGNFLRFPGQAVQNGAGVFMIPYLISLVLLGIPICWAEWTLGRLGGSRGFNSSPGIFYALWHHPLAKFFGALGMIIPVGVYTYYVYIEAWCLAISVDFMQGLSFDQEAGQASEYWGRLIGSGENGAVFTGDTPILWFALICFLVNFTLIYRGISKGIEAFCKVAMPLLILFAIAMLVRVLTLDPYTDADGATRTVSDGLGFMWNPDWSRLGDANVWLAAAGQFFFSLSVGFGIILTYSSYLQKDDDVVLSGLTASSMNEFCEVILGGMICVPAAFIFLGAEAASQGTFGLGFSTMPAIFDFLPGGTGPIFGAIWFGLLFLAAVTSSVSMLQPAIAFLEEGFALRRRNSVAILGALTIVGAGLIILFSKGAAALDAVDFWIGTFLIFILASGQVILFGWIYGAERGRQEANRGADLQIPRAFSFVIKYVTPLFLLVVFALWCIQTLPGRIDAMSPGYSASTGLASTYESQIRKAIGKPKEATDESGLEAWKEKTVNAALSRDGFEDPDPLATLVDRSHADVLTMIAGSEMSWAEAVQSNATRAAKSKAANARAKLGSNEEVDPAAVFVKAYESLARGFVDLKSKEEPLDPSGLEEWRASLTTKLENRDFQANDLADLSAAVAELDGQLFASLSDLGSGWGEAAKRDVAREAGQAAVDAADAAVIQRTTSILLILVLIGFVLVTNAAGRLWKKQGYEPGGALKA